VPYTEYRPGGGLSCMAQTRPADSPPVKAWHSQSGVAETSASPAADSVRKPFATGLETPSLGTPPPGAKQLSAEIAACKEGVSSEGLGDPPQFPAPVQTHRPAPPPFTNVKQNAQFPPWRRMTSTTTHGHCVR